MRPESLPVGFETHWEQYLRDEQLLRFLKYVHFSATLRTEKIQDYLAVAKVVAGTPAIPVSAERKFEPRPLLYDLEKELGPFYNAELTISPAGDSSENEFRSYSAGIKWIKEEAIETIRSKSPDDAEKLLTLIERIGAYRSCMSCKRG